MRERGRRGSETREINKRVKRDEIRTKREGAVGGHRERYPSTWGRGGVRTYELHRQAKPSGRHGDTADSGISCGLADHVALVELQGKHRVLDGERHESGTRD